MVFSLGTKLIELLILSFSSYEFFLCIKFILLVFYFLFLNLSSFLTIL